MVLHDHSYNLIGQGESTEPSSQQCVFDLCWLKVQQRLANDRVTLYLQQATPWAFWNDVMVKDGPEGF